MEERVKQLLDRLRGQLCWSAIAGPEHDYLFVLHFGAKHRRSLRLANPRLSFVQRTFEGAFSLLVECAWRIDGPDRVIASCWDPVEARADALDGLVDLHVRSITAEPPGYDLQLGFDGGYALRCLSVESDLDYERDNWNLFIPEGHIRVGPRAWVELRTAEEAQREFERWRLSLVGDEEGGPSRFPPRWPRPAEGPRAGPPPTPEPSGDDEPPPPTPLWPDDGSTR